MKAMDVQSRVFKDLAIQCSYQTQKSTLGELKALESQTKTGNQEVLRQLALSRSEAHSQHVDATDVHQVEGERNRRSIRDLQMGIAQLRTDQLKLNTLMSMKAKREELERESQKAELKKVLKELHRSNERIDPRTNDSQCFANPREYD